MYQSNLEEFKKKITLAYIKSWLVDGKKTLKKRTKLNDTN